MNILFGAIFRVKVSGQNICAEVNHGVQREHEYNNDNFTHFFAYY